MQHNQFHVVVRCKQREYFPLPMVDVWQIMVSELNEIHKNFGVGIHSFVLMGNHFHLLCHEKSENKIDLAIEVLLLKSSDKILKLSGKDGYIWDGDIKKTLIRSRVYYQEVYHYIYQNPLRAKIVSDLEEYSYSTLISEVPFPVYSFLPLAFAGIRGEVFWLNRQNMPLRTKLVNFELS